MDAGFWGVTGTLFGTALGTASPWAREWLFERNERKKRASYLAIRIVCILDDFILGCYDVVCNADNIGTPLPEPSNPILSEFPSDIDWKAIEPILAYRILAIKSKIKAANESIYFISTFAAFPEDSDTIEERQYQHALLGLIGEAIAEKLRVDYSIPHREDGDMKCVDRFQKAKTEIEAARCRRNSSALSEIEADFDNIELPNSCGHKPM